MIEHGSSIGSALKEARAQLASTTESAFFDAQALLASVIGKSTSYLHTRPDAQMSETDYHGYRDLVGLRASGLPVAYLTGFREFWSIFQSRWRAVPGHRGGVPGRTLPA